MGYKILFKIIFIGLGEMERDNVLLKDMSGVPTVVRTDGKLSLSRVVAVAKQHDLHGIKRQHLHEGHKFATKLGIATIGFGYLKTDFPDPHCSFG